MPESSNEKPVSHHHVGVYVTFSRGYPVAAVAKAPMPTSIMLRIIMQYLNKHYGKLR